MEAPTKPWEDQYNRNSYIHSRGVGGVPTTGGMSAPPLPPRNYRQSQQTSLLGLSSPYYPRYGGPTGGFGLGGFAGGMGYPYSAPYYGRNQHDYDSRFVQMAEESVSPTFEAIEGFVRGFTAFNMMLESTYQALHMSFRAALGVAENMTKIKAAIIGTLASISVLKKIYLFYRRILHLLGLVNGAELDWEEAAGGPREVAVTSGPGIPKWPILAFFGFIIAGPTLIYKFLIPKQIPEEEEVKLLATHDFTAETGAELSFRKGETLSARRSDVKRGWIKARRGTAEGYIPSNRVTILSRKLEDVARRHETVQPTSSQLYQQLQQQHLYQQPQTQQQIYLQPQTQRQLIQQQLRNTPQNSQLGVKNFPQRPQEETSEQTTPQIHLNKSVNKTKEFSKENTLKSNSNETSNNGEEGEKIVSGETLREEPPSISDNKSLDTKIEINSTNSIETTH